MVGRGNGERIYAFSTAIWKPSSSLARGTTRPAPAVSNSFFISASSAGDTGFGAAATDRSTKTLVARSRAAARWDTVPCF